MTLCGCLLSTPGTVHFYRHPRDILLHMRKEAGLGDLQPKTLGNIGRRPNSSFTHTGHWAEEAMRPSTQHRLAIDQKHANAHYPLTGHMVASKGSLL
jgi:hypothetical protein